jgi:hypothetical protein
MPIASRPRGRRPRTEAAIVRLSHKSHEKNNPPPGISRVGEPFHRNELPLLGQFQDLRTQAGVGIVYNPSNEHDTRKPV